MTPLTLFVIDDNGLIEKARYMRRADGRSEETYSDYRNVDGIQVAVSHRGAARPGSAARARRARPIRFNVPCRRRSSSSRADRRVAERLRVMISCGEPSGDLYAGALATEILRLEPDASSPASAASGCAPPARRWSATSRALGDRADRGAARDSALVAELSRARPRRRSASGPTCSCRSTFPTSISFSRARCTSAACRSCYYISPQLWAWRRGRLKTMKRVVDRVLVIFPFEAPFYDEARRAGHVRRASARSS